MGLAGVSLGRELTELYSEPHRALRCGVGPPDNSVTNTRTDCALSRTKRSAAPRPHQPLLEEHVCKAAPGLAHRVGAEWRGAHVVGAAAQVERAALTYASAASAAHSRVYGGCAAEAGVSEVSGSRVSGCPRAPRYFNPYPVALPYP
jgi:hypothetical protein